MHIAIPIIQSVRTRICSSKPYSTPFSIILPILFTIFVIIAPYQTSAGSINLLPFRHHLISLGGHHLLTFTIPSDFTTTTTTTPNILEFGTSSPTDPSLCSVFRQYDPLIDLFANSYNNLTQAHGLCYRVPPKYYDNLSNIDILSITKLDPIGSFVVRDRLFCKNWFKFSAQDSFNSVAEFRPLTASIRFGSDEWVTCMSFYQPVGIAPDFPPELQIKGHTLMSGLIALLSPAFINYSVRHKGFLSRTFTSRTDLIAVNILQSTTGQHPFRVVPNPDFDQYKDDITFDMAHDYYQDDHGPAGFYCYRKGDFLFGIESDTHIAGDTLIDYKIKPGARRMGRVYYNPSEHAGMIHLLYLQTNEDEPITCLLPIRAPFYPSVYHILVGENSIANSETNSIVIQSPSSKFTTLTQLYAEYVSTNVKTTRQTNTTNPYMAVRGSDSIIHQNLVFTTSSINNEEGNSGQDNTVQQEDSTTSSPLMEPLEGASTIARPIGRSNRSALSLQSQFKFLPHPHTNSATRYRLLYKQLTMVDEPWSIHYTHLIEIDTLRMELFQQERTSKKKLEDRCVDSEIYPPINDNVGEENTLSGTRSKFGPLKQSNESPKSTNPIKKCFFTHSTKSTVIYSASGLGNAISTYLSPNMLSSVTNTTKITNHNQADSKYRYTSGTNPNDPTNSYHWILEYAEPADLPISPSKYDVLQFDFTPTTSTPAPVVTVRDYNSSNNSTFTVPRNIVINVDLFYRRLPASSIDFSLIHWSSEQYNAYNAAHNQLAAVPNGISDQNIPILLGPMMVVEDLSVKTVPVALPYDILTSVNAQSNYTQLSLLFLLQYSVMTDNLKRAQIITDPKNIPYIPSLSQPNKDKLQVEQNETSSIHPSGTKSMIKEFTAFEAVYTSLCNFISENPVKNFVTQFLKFIFDGSSDLQSSSLPPQVTEFYEKLSKLDHTWNNTARDVNLNADFRTIYSPDPAKIDPDLNPMKLLYAHKMTFETTMSFPTIGGQTSLQAAFSFSHPIQYPHMPPKCRVSLNNGIYIPITRRKQPYEYDLNQTNTDPIRDPLPPTFGLDWKEHPYFYYDYSADPLLRYKNLLSLSGPQVRDITRIHQQIETGDIFYDFGNYFFSTDNFTIPIINVVRTSLNISRTDWDPEKKVPFSLFNEDMTAYTPSDPDTVEILTNKTLDYLVDLYQTTLHVSCDIFLDKYQAIGPNVELISYFKLKEMRRWVKRTAAVTAKSYTTPYQPTIISTNNFRQSFQTPHVINYILHTPYTITSQKEFDTLLESIITIFTTLPVNHYGLTYNPNTNNVEYTQLNSPIFNNSIEGLKSITTNDISLVTSQYSVDISDIRGVYTDPYNAQSVSSLIPSGSLISLVFNLTSPLQHNINTQISGRNTVFTAGPYQIHRGNDPYFIPSCTLTDWLSKPSVEINQLPRTSMVDSLAHDQNGPYGPFFTNKIIPLTYQYSYGSSYRSTNYRSRFNTLSFHAHPFPHSICGPQPSFGRKCDNHAQCNGTPCNQGICLTPNQHKVVLQRSSSYFHSHIYMATQYDDQTLQTLNSIRLQTYFSIIPFYPQNGAISFSLAMFYGIFIAGWIMVSVFC